MLVKNKIQLSNFKDLTGFIQQFINGAASSLADRKELQRAIQGKEGFYRQKGAGTRKLYWAKKWIG